MISGKNVYRDYTIGIPTKLSRFWSIRRVWQGMADSCGVLTAQTGQPIAFSQLMLLKFSFTTTTERLFIFKHFVCMAVSFAFLNIRRSNTRHFSPLLRLFAAWWLCCRRVSHSLPHCCHCPSRQRPPNSSIFATCSRLQPMFVVGQSLNITLPFLPKGHYGPCGPYSRYILWFMALLKTKQ